MATMKAHNFVGLSTPVYLPDDIAVEIAIVPSSVRNVRSNQWETGQTSYTQHETSNFNRGANADMHKRWLHAGAGGAYVGFNFVVDDRKIIQLTPLSEVTWAAGTPNGNRYSWHSELCVNSDINHTRARRNAAALAGGVLAAKKWSTSKLVQHNYWTGKNCPLIMRRDGLWPSFVNQVATFAAGGGGDAPAPVVEFGAGDTLKVTSNLNVRRGWGTGQPVVTTLPAGTIVTVGKDSDGRYQQDANGYRWYNIAYQGGSGWAAGDWLVLEKKAEAKPADPKPGDGWPYPDPVVPGFWETLMSDGATHVFDGGYLWVRAENLYRVKSGTKRQQYAVGDDRVVGPDLQAGEEFRSAAIGQSGMDAEAWMITPGLTRVRMSDVEYVEEAEESAASAA